MKLDSAKPILGLTVIWVGILGVILNGCASDFKDRAHHVWRYHERVFEEALKGNQKDEQLGEACLFFEELTGIKLHVDIFTLGYLPRTEAKNDLVLLRRWYKNNSHLLYWDESEQKVRLKQGGSS